MKTSPTGRRVKTINEFIKNYSVGLTAVSEMLAKRDEKKPDFIHMDFALIEARTAAWLEGKNHGE